VAPAQPGTRNTSHELTKRCTQECQRRVLCYATANVLRDEADRMAVRFADH
jgi:hypothetical protein